MVFYFIILWKVNYVCLELTKIDLSSGTGPCIYQNIGGEWGIVKLKEEKLQRKYFRWTKIIVHLYIPA